MHNAGTGVLIGLCGDHMITKPSVNSLALVKRDIGLDSDRVVVSTIYHEGNLVENVYNKTVFEEGVRGRSE